MTRIDSAVYKTIEKISLSNAILRSTLDYQRSGFCTHDEALCIAVNSLATECKRLIALVDNLKLKHDSFIEIHFKEFEYIDVIDYIVNCKISNSGKIMYLHQIYIEFLKCTVDLQSISSSTVVLNTTVK